MFLPFRFMPVIGSKTSVRIPNVVTSSSTTVLPDRTPTRNV